MEERRKSKEYSSDPIEKRGQLWEEGYYPMSFLAEHALERFKKDPEHYKCLITTYYFGTRFSHVDAYELCSLGKIWPEFCIHPKEKEYVLRFMRVNNTTGLRKWASKFEEWIDKNRQQFCKDVAQNLSIDWEEIEKLKDNPLLFML